MSDNLEDYYQVECPRCRGGGLVFIDRNHPLHTEFGHPVGWITCETCDGDKFMLTNGKGVFVRRRKEPKQ